MSLRCSILRPLCPVLFFWLFVGVLRADPARQLFPPAWLDADPPRPSSTRDTQILARWGEGRCDLLASDSLYACLRNGSLLQIHDIRFALPDPSNLLWQGAFPVEEASQILLLDHRLWIAAGPEGLVHLDPADPQDVEHIDLEAWRLFVCQQLLGVLDPAGLTLLDPSDTTDPEFVGELDLFQSHYDAACDGRWLYLAAGSFDLRIIDLVNPATPFVVRSQAFPGGLYTLGLGDSLLFASSSSQVTGILGLDRSRPDSLSLLGNTSFGIAQDLVVLEQSLLAAGGSDGLSHIPLDAAGAPLAAEDLAVDEGAWRITGIPGNRLLGGMDHGLRSWQALAPPFAPQHLQTLQTGGRPLAAGDLGEYSWLLDEVYGLRLLQQQGTDLRSLSVYGQGGDWLGARMRLGEVVLYGEEGLVRLRETAGAWEEFAVYESDSPVGNLAVLGADLVLENTEGTLFLLRPEADGGFALLQSLPREDTAEALLGGETSLWRVAAGELQVFALESETLALSQALPLPDYQDLTRNGNTLFLQQANGVQQVYRVTEGDLLPHLEQPTIAPAGPALADGAFLHVADDLGVYTLRWLEGLPGPLSPLSGSAGFLPLASTGRHLYLASPARGLLLAENLEANRAPVIQAPATLVLAEDSLSMWNTAGWASDPEGHAWSLEVLPHAWITAETSAGQLLLQAHEDRWGSGELWLAVNDWEPDGRRLQALVVQVQPRADAPRPVEPLPEISLLEDADPLSLALDSLFTDVDGEPLVYEALIPAALDLEISDGTGLLSVAPDSNGVYTLELIARDPGGLEAQAGIQVFVEAVPDCPRLLAGSAEGSEDQELVLPAFGQRLSDADGEIPWLCSLRDTSGIELAWNLAADTLRLQPPADANGALPLLACIDDGLCQVTDTLWLDLQAVNDCPQPCRRQPRLSTVEDTLLPRDMLHEFARSAGCDADGDSLQVLQLEPLGPGFDWVQLEGAWFLQPPDNFNGSTLLFARLSDDQCELELELGLDYRPRADSLQVEYLVPCGRVDAYEAIDSLAVRLYHPDRDEALVRWVRNGAILCEQQVEGLRQGWVHVPLCLIAPFSGSEMLHAEILQDGVIHNENGQDCQWLLPLVGVEEEPALPGRLVLAAPFPNPFNPRLQLRFGLPRPELVCLQVYNLLGERVAEIENGLLEAGWHTRSWHAAGLAGGLYLVRLQAGEEREVRRVLLLE